MSLILLTQQLIYKIIYGKAWWIYIKLEYVTQALNLTDKNLINGRQIARSLGSVLLRLTTT